MARATDLVCYSDPQCTILETDAATRVSGSVHYSQSRHDPLQNALRLQLSLIAASNYFRISCADGCHPFRSESLRIEVSF